MVSPERDLPGSPRLGVCMEHSPICVTVGKLPNVSLVPVSVKWGCSLHFPRDVQERGGAICETARSLELTSDVTRLSGGWQDRL